MSSLSLTWSSFLWCAFWVNQEHHQSPKVTISHRITNYYCFVLHFVGTQHDPWISSCRGESLREENWMDSEHMSNKNDMKVETPQETEMVSPTSGLTRQPSSAKSNCFICLCSPTTHAGSFRCRLHRAPSLQRTKSIDSKDSTSKADATSNANTIEAQWLFLRYYVLYICQIWSLITLLLISLLHCFCMMMFYSFCFNPVNIFY